jgi:uncharacterized RDD family membrane protein YckC
MRPPSPRAAPEGYVSDWGGAGAATAQALEAHVFEAGPFETAGGFETLEGGRRAGNAGAAPRAERRETIAAEGYQQALFREGGAHPKVVPIPTMTPARREPREAPRRRLARNADSQMGRSARGTALAERSSRAAQQDLFQGGEPAVAVPAEVICCDVPVAVPAQRMLAAATDGSLILVATGVVLVVFLVGGGEMVFNRDTVPFLAGVVAVLALFYRILWGIADGDTPGMRFAGLRLVDFDGRKPQREARLLRQAAGLLSLGSLGLGLVWALVDEESLTWHDHISKTFPTAG